jgi:hypothetical protein
LEEPEELPEEPGPPEPGPSEEAPGPLEKSLPPVPVEFVVPERKEPFMRLFNPSFVCVLASYSWLRNWNTYVSSRKFLGSM